MSIRPRKIQKSIASSRREHSSAEEGRQFDDATVEKLLKKYHFCDVCNESEPNLACRQGLKENNRFACCRVGYGVYSPIWSKENGSEVCPSEWGKQARPSLLAIQYATHLECNFITNVMCDKCKTRVVKKTKRRYEKRKKERNEFNSKCLEEGEWHLRKCNKCGYSGGRRACGYTMESNVTCIVCVTETNATQKQRAENHDKGSSTGCKVCVLCTTEKKQHEFQMVCVSIKDDDVRKLVEHLDCVDCSIKRKHTRVERRNHEKKRLQMAKEKLDRWRSLMEAEPECKGCGGECPCDFLQLESKIREVLHKKLLGDKDQVKKRLDIIMASMLEWDHNEPLLKRKNVSDIWNDAERAAEISKCTLRCIICHRLKTFKFGDGMKNDTTSYKGRVMRKKLLEYLEFKKATLESDKNKGRCVSYFEECPMEQAIESFRNKSSKDFSTKIPMDVLVLILYDFDHIDRATKLGNVGKMRSFVESKKCNLSCCICHRGKSIFEGDLGASDWVAYRRKEGEPLEGELGEEIGLGTQAESANVPEIQMDLDLRVDIF